MNLVINLFFIYLFIFFFCVLRRKMAAKSGGKSIFASRLGSAGQKFR